MKKGKKINTKKVVLKSGDNIGNGIACCDCGKRFIDSYNEKDDIGKSIDDLMQSIICTCGKRIAYIVE